MAQGSIKESRGSGKFYLPSPGPVQAEVAKAGATRGTVLQHHEHHTVMADPEGNKFCLEPRPAHQQGQRTRLIAADEETPGSRRSCIVMHLHGQLRRSRRHQRARPFRPTCPKRSAGTTPYGGGARAIPAPPPSSWRCPGSRGKAPRRRPACCTATSPASGSPPPYAIARTCPTRKREGASTSAKVRSGPGACSGRRSATTTEEPVRLTSISTQRIRPLVVRRIRSRSEE